MGQHWDQFLSGASINSVTDVENLPPLFACPLTDWALTSLTGEQSKDYLQGQLTCDLQKLTADNYLTGAHCDAKGKMWAIVKTFLLDDHYLLSGHSSELDACRTQLQKYGVFSKTTISDANEQWFTFGLGGNDAANWLQSQWKIDTTGQASAWNISTQNDNTQNNTAGKVLKISDSRFLLFVNAEHMPAVLTLLAQYLYQQDLWSILNIQAGIAHLGESTINQYVPQMLNLQCLDAISFEKGCYTGQEMVARMKYLGKNKRAAFILTGNATERPIEGQDLQLAVGDNWRRSGTVINVAGTAQKLHILAVLPNDLAVDAQLRIKDDANSAFTITPLPYPLAVD